MFTFGGAQTENYLNGDPTETFSTIIDPENGSIVDTAITPDSISFTPDASDPLHPGFVLGGLEVLSIEALTEQLDWGTSVQLLNTSNLIGGLTVGLNFLIDQGGCPFISLGPDMPVGELGCGVPIEYDSYSEGPFSSTADITPTNTLNGLSVGYGGTAVLGAFEVGDFSYQLNETPEPNSLILLGTALFAVLAVRRQLIRATAFANKLAGLRNVNRSL